MSVLQLWLLSLLATSRDYTAQADYVDNWLHEMYGCPCRNQVPSLSN